RLHGAVEPRQRWLAHRVDFAKGPHPVVIASERFDGVFPAVDGVRDKTVEYAERALFAIFRTAFDCARERRGVFETAGRQRASNFEVGIDAIRRAPKELQQQPIAETDCSVAL